MVYVKLQTRVEITANTDKLKPYIFYCKVLIIRILLENDLSCLCSGLTGIL